MTDLETGGPRRRLRPLVLDDALTICLGDEAVRAGGEICGRVTTGAYGHRVDQSIAYADVAQELEPGITVEICVFNEWKPATIANEPLYDPQGLRIREIPTEPTDIALVG